MWFSGRKLAPGALVWRLVAGCASLAGSLWALARQAAVASYGGRDSSLGDNNAAERRCQAACGVVVLIGRAIGQAMWRYRARKERDREFAVSFLKCMSGVCHLAGGVELYGCTSRGSDGVEPAGSWWRLARSRPNARALAGQTPSCQWQGSRWDNAAERRHQPALGNDI
jgi:hypothetical protein